VGVVPASFVLAEDAVFLATFLLRDAPRRGIRTLLLAGHVGLGVGFRAPRIVVIRKQLHGYCGPWIELLDVLKNKQEFPRILWNCVLVEIVLILPASRTVSQHDVSKLHLVKQFDDLRG